MSNQKSKDTPTVAIKKVARVWSIVIIVLALLILVVEVVSPPTETDYPWVENLMPISMFLSVFSLGLAWRWELLGGALNVGFYVVNFIIYWAVNGEFMHLAAVLFLGVAIVPGILFLVCWRISPKVQHEGA
jgi:hypothetical protein